MSVDDPEIDVLPVREAGSVEEALQPVLQEARRIRDRERDRGRAGGGTDVDRLGPDVQRLAANEAYVPCARRSGELDEEAASERGRRHAGEMRDRGGVVTTAGGDGGEDEQPGEASAHDRRIR